MNFVMLKQHLAKSELNVSLKHQSRLILTNLFGPIVSFTALYFQLSAIVVIKMTFACLKATTKHCEVLYPEDLSWATLVLFTAI